MTEDGVRIAYATTGKGTPIVRPGHWLESGPARATFFVEVQCFLGDKPRALSKGAVKRQARGFHAATQRLYHVIEPYYMVVAVVAAVVGVVSFLVTKLM